ncbi:MAG: hypothetical protein K2M91_09350 [Lachnospiraceae bacterium]|nr:hypothetical protein [Lachnospiraceae bacterium]
MASKNRLGQAAETSVNGFFTNAEESKQKADQTTRENKKSYTNEQKDEALKAAYRTDRQQDEADLPSINKGTFNKTKREIEENELERVEHIKVGIAAEKETTAKDTPQIVQKPTEPPEPIRTVENTPKKEKYVYETNTKPQKAVMGFRAEVDKIELWKLYADAAEQEISAMCTAALDEYIHNHELTADQKEIFDIKKQALEAEKKIKSRKKNNS